MRNGLVAVAAAASIGAPPLAQARSTDRQAIISQPPPPPAPFVPPSSTIISPPGGWTCDAHDPRTSAQACRNGIDGAEHELRRLDEGIAKGTLLANSPALQKRIRFWRQKLARDNQTLRFVLLHPDHFGSMRPKRPAGPNE